MRPAMLVAPFVVALALPGGASAQQPDDRQFAQQLWDALVEANLIGENAVRSRPYEGTEPHGAILEFLARPLTVGDREGTAIVKKNYVGEGVSIERVWADGRDLLDSHTVMFQREAGYDPEHGDWYWAKYQPDGSVDAAGKVEGCISCHEGAEGGDYVFSY